VAVANGFVGSEAAWLASLVGPTGATGAAGADGDDGATGPAGADGAAGSRIYSGTGAPAGGSYLIGDWYLNDANGDWYEKTGASAWTLRDNLTGPQGSQGIQGIQGIQGPTGATGSDGWTYVRVTTEFSTTSATAVDVIRDGASAVLGFTPAASTDYEFEALLYTRTPTTATVGVRPGLAWPTGMTNGVAELENPTSATAVSRVFGNVNAALLAAVGGLPNTTQSYPARIRGAVRAGASPSGLVRVQCASETAATAVRVEVGSFLKYRVVA
jgi:hypothetical protein